LLAGCSFKYRGVDINPAFGEGAQGFLAKKEWVKRGYCTLVYLKEGKPIVLLYHKNEIKAFVSICPHTACEVNDGERFQKLSKGRIRCLIHDSYFDPENGKRLRGPASPGSELPPFPIKFKNEKIFRADVG